jgi:hypothetical protein
LETLSRLIALPVGVMVPVPASMDDDQFDISASLG